MANAVFDTTAKVTIVVTDEQTGTGSSQNIAHGQAKTPIRVIFIPTFFDYDGADLVITPGTHDDTNIVVTAAPSGVKFVAQAFFTNEDGEA